MAPVFRPIGSEKGHPPEMRQAFQNNEITSLTAIFAAILLKGPCSGKNGFQEKSWPHEALYTGLLKAHIGHVKLGREIIHD